MEQGSGTLSRPHDLNAWWNRPMKIFARVRLWMTDMMKQTSSSKPLIVLQVVQKAVFVKLDLPWVFVVWVACRECCLIDLIYTGALWSFSLKTGSFQQPFVFLPSPDCRWMFNIKKIAGRMKLQDKWNGFQIFINNFDGWIIFRS